MKKTGHDWRIDLTCVPDAESTWGGRVVCANDSAMPGGACGFIGKVADLEPKDSYGPEHEEAWEKIARGDEQYLPARCRQMSGDPIEDETEIKRITDALLRAYPPRGLDDEPKASAGPESEEEMEKRVAGIRLRYRRGTAQGGRF